MSVSSNDDLGLPLDHLTEEEVRLLNEKFNLTRGQRIRAAMFPETLELEPFTLPNIDPRKPNAIKVLSTPAQELKNAIADILNYQLDVDFAAKFLPEISRLLADPDRDVVRNAAELTRDLSGSEAARFVMTGSPDLVSALLAAIARAGDSSTDRKMAEAATTALLNLCDSERGRQTVFRCGGIPVLVRLLLSPADRVVNYALTTLHGLLQWQDGAKEAVRAAGGIQNMIPLLTTFSRDPRFLCVLLDSLHILCFEEAESKLAVLNNGGPKELVVLHRKTTDDKVLWMASRLIKVLSACDQNKESFAEHGAFGAVIVRLKTSRDPRVMKNSLTTLRNLSDATSRLYVDDEIIRYLLDFLRLDDREEEEKVLLAAGTVGNLSADKPYLKRLIFNNEGLERTVEALTINQREDIIDPLFCTLRHLTSDTSETGAAARQRLRELRAIPLCVDLLVRTRCWPVVKAGAGLSRNLLSSYETHEEMVHMNIIPRLSNIIDLATQERTRRSHLLQHLPSNPRSSVSSNSNSNSLRRQARAEDVSEDGVDLNDVLEDAISGLIHLAESDPNKDTIRETGVLDVLDILLSPDAPSRPSDSVAEAASALKALLPPETEEEFVRDRELNASIRSQRMSERDSLIHDAPSPPPHSPSAESSTFETRLESVVNDRLEEDNLNQEEPPPIPTRKDKKAKKEKKGKKNKKEKEPV